MPILVINEVLYKKLKFHVHRPIIGAYYFAANAMVFGSVASASSWEPFRQAIECLAAVYFGNKSLAIKHEYWLDMV